jgi:hypothetical protein
LGAGTPLDQRIDLGNRKIQKQEHRVILSVSTNSQSRDYFRPEGIGLNKVENFHVVRESGWESNGVSI